MRAAIPEQSGPVTIVGLGAQLACLVACEKPGCTIYWKAVQVTVRRKDNDKTCKDGFNMEWKDVNSKLEGNLIVK